MFNLTPSSLNSASFNSDIYTIDKMNFFRNHFTPKRNLEKNLFKSWKGKESADAPN